MARTISVILGTQTPYFNERFGPLEKVSDILKELELDDIDGRFEAETADGAIVALSPHIEITHGTEELIDYFLDYEEYRAGRST